MGERKSDDWLPEGWRVEVKVRRNGKKDKFYFPPSGRGRFCSKPEVSRYLNNCNPKPEQKKESNDYQSAKKVFVEIEKAIPEGLPPGWTKETRVTRKGHTVRRDPFYTDPVSGYVFRSMKDALRYIESGELGRLAFKPKDKGSIDMDLEGNKAYSPAADKKQKVVVERISSPSISAQSSKSSEIATDEQILNSGSTGEGGAGTASSRSELPEDNGSDQPEGKSDYAKSAFGVATAVGVLEVRTESSFSEVPEEKGSEQTEGTSDSSKTACKPAPSVGGPDKRSLESEVIKIELKRPGLSNSKKKKGIALPRRTSKRLAGIPLDPTPELKKNRTCPAAVKQSSEMVASTLKQSAPYQLNAEQEAKHGFDACKSTKMVLESSQRKHSVGIAAHTGKDETEAQSTEEYESSFVSPPGIRTIPGHHDKVETDHNAEEKPGLLLDPSFGELWQDPCIAFAIKTLTGISLDASDSIKTSAVSNNVEFRGLATLEECPRKEDEGVDNNQGCTMALPLGDLAIREEQPGDVETSDKADEKSGSLLHSPFADAWMDPCIEFAIKTLTGAIPVDYNMVIQGCSPQQVSSSQLQESCRPTLPNVGEFCQTELLCQQYGGSEKPLFKQAALLEPAIQPKNTNFGYWGETSCRKQNDEASNMRQR